MCLCVLRHVRTDDCVYRKLVKKSDKIAKIRIIGISRPYNVGQMCYVVKQYVPIAYKIVYKRQNIQEGALCHRPSVRADKMKGIVTGISVKWNFKCYRELKQGV